MLTSLDKRTLQSTWKLAAPIANTVGDLFYKRLFELRPDLRASFPADLSALKKKFVTMLDFIVQSTQWSEEEWRATVDQDRDLLLVILALGRRHAALYKVPQDAYAVVGEALIWTLDMGLGEAFTEDARATWVKVYKMISSMMQMGAKSQRLPT